MIKLISWKFSVLHIIYVKLLGEKNFSCCNTKKTLYIINLALQHSFHYFNNDT